MDDPLQIVFSILSLAWVLLTVARCGISFFRFRSTASGLLIGGGYALLSLVALGFRILLWTGSEDVRMFIFESVPLILLRILSTFVLLLVVAVGVFLLPRSLQQLASKS